MIWFPILVRKVFFPGSQFFCSSIGHDANGNPVLLDDLDVDVRYGATTDALGSINSYSRGKTGFWSYANGLFGASLVNGEGLTGLFMPADDPQNRGAQPMAYIPASDGFRAEGIPITPTDDANLANPYPLMEVSAYDKQTGQQTGSLKVVVPVATETECQGCHRNGGVGAAPRGITSPDTGVEVQSKRNILKLHDVLEGTTLQASTPVLCAGCHYSPALDLAGTGPAGGQVGNVNDGRWVDENHGDFYEQNKSDCKACHGLDLLGTVLSAMPAARTFRMEMNTVTFAKGDLVRCNRCHSRPGL